MPKQLTLFELSAVPEGARVVFVEPFDIFPDAHIPVGTICTLKENGLNEISPLAFLLPDDTELRDKLREWDGLIYIKGGNPASHHGDEDWEAEWQALSPVALAK